MSQYKFNLNNLQNDPFNFYLTAAKQNRDFFEKNLLAFNYIQISTYNGMKELFRNPHLIKPKSYKKIGKAYNLSGALINDGEVWEVARKSTQATLFNVTKEEIENVTNEVFQIFKQKISKGGKIDLLPITRVFIQHCLNIIFFQFSEWELNTEISKRVRELELITFNQQWSPLFQIFGKNFYLFKTRNKRNELLKIFEENFLSRNETSRFKSWIEDVEKLELNLKKQDFIFNEIFNLWVAANEATSNTLCWAMYIATDTLAQNSGALDDSKFINGCLQEAQRYYPAAYFIAREATQNISYQDRKIKKGSIINFSTYAMNRDPEYFKDPESRDYLTSYNGLKAQKPPYSFGHGKRICSGRAIAEVLMPVFLENLFKNFQIKPVDSKPIPMAHVSLTSKNGFVFNLIPK